MGGGTAAVPRSTVDVSKVALSPQCSPVNGDAIAVPHSTVSENKEDAASESKAGIDIIEEDKAGVGIIEEDKASAGIVPWAAALPPSPASQRPTPLPI